MLHSSKDPAITLFGRKIPLSDDGEPPAIFPSQKHAQSGKDSIIDDNEKDDADDSRNLERLQEDSENPKTPSIDEETAKPSNGKPESESPSSEKTLKKPDKLLPCPRCKSMETKFCYYNNYNVNQPRYFCKACQRYWTAGGSMRNVPVGAGRRKTKTSGSYYRHITISEALEAARFEVPKGTHSPKFSANNGRVLCFNSDPAENRVKSSSLSSESDHLQKINGFPSQSSYLSGVPWPFVWNSSVPPGFPMSIFPAPPGWNCGISGPWFSSPQPQASSTLGKHQRDNEMAKEEGFKQRNGCVLTPKTLRIDDPSEAAKSSIWATLGIKNESITGPKSLLKTFQPKAHEKVHVPETSSVLQANPAALSRSLVFRESS